MPEKTRDRKSWFPRFKSNWLGTYRSKQMFVCCECGVKDGDTSRYKGAEGKHCACGKDQWHLAKSVEEAEYNRRMEISKAFGGLRYDEALQRLKTMGASEHDLQRARATSESSDCGSDAMSERAEMPTMPLPPVAAHAAFPHAHPHANSLQHDYHHHHMYDSMRGEYANAKPEYQSNQAYTPVGVDLLGPFGNPEFPNYALSEEEALGFGEMLQDIMEDDGSAPRGAGYGGYAPAMKAAAAYPMYAPQQQQPQQMDSNMEYYSSYPAKDMHHYSMGHHHAPFNAGYPHCAPPLTTAFASDL